MKHTHIILIILLAVLFNGKAANSEGHSNQAIEQTLTNADTISSADPAQPIIKTVVIEEEEDTTSPPNKWITAALAILGIILVVVFRMLRKKKKTGKSLDK